MLNSRKFAFLYAIILVIVVILSEAVTILAALGGPDARLISIIFNVVGFSLSPLIPIILIGIFDYRALKRIYWFYIPSVLNIILVLLSGFLNVIFYVDANNVYIRGNFFFLFVITYIINVILFVLVVWYKSRNDFYPIKAKIIYLASFVLAGSMIQIIFPYINSTWHVATISILLLYILLFDFEGNFDALTKLYNRAAFEKELLKLKSKTTYSIIMIDINNFKNVNDSCGHGYGDEVLIDVANVIKSVFDNATKYYRIGGDEFCIICNDCNKEKLELRLNLMNDHFAKTREKNTTFPTIAYGFCIVSRENLLSVQDALKEADQKMYQSKKQQGMIKD